VLELLRLSQRPGVQDLLRTRELTNTTIFPPSQSASGQAFDAALCVCGLLLEEGRLTTALSNSIVVLARNANGGGSPQPFEQVLIDLMSLGQRLNWGQLGVLAGRVERPETLRLLGNLVRRHERQISVLFCAVVLSGKPDDVAKYLMTFGDSGIGDLGASLRYRAGGLNELLRRNQRLAHSPYHTQIAVDSSLRTPGFALTLKWVCYVAAGFYWRWRCILPDRRFRPWKNRCRCGDSIMPVKFCLRSDSC